MRKKKITPNRTNRVAIFGEVAGSDSASRLIGPVLMTAMRALRLVGTDLSVAFVSDREIAELNRKYRRKNGPTDVLSFAMDTSRTPEGRRILGDVVISLPTARRQAREDKKPIEREFILLAIHGLLHLLGHDHERPKDAARMFPIQNRLVKKAIDALK